MKKILLLNFLQLVILSASNAYEMKIKQSISIFPFLIMGIFLLFASSCEKDDDNTPSSNNPTNNKTNAIFNPSVTYGTMTDQDGKSYKTIKIGTQTWMAENLRTTKYNDGTDIPNITGDDEWDGLSTGAYCNYNNTNNTDTIDTYGRLYNWHAVNTGKLAPKGWHVPTDAEWTQLTDYLGGKSIAGGKLKETGNTHWASPNEGATNETGFTALPGGYRLYSGSFLYIGLNGFWWSATEHNATDAWLRYLYCNYSIVLKKEYDKELGFSVRCVKDEPSVTKAEVETNSATDVSENSATLNAVVVSDGGTKITQQGFYWSRTNDTPDSGDNAETVSGTIGSFNKTISGLQENTMYYYRAFATNSEGISTGEVISFQTEGESGGGDITYGTFIDSRDNNTYKTVKIGNQEWMAENLAYLPSVNQDTNGSENAESSYYYVYGFDGTNVTNAKVRSNYKTYGVLYNWPAATNACPSGWHLPSDDEWTQLVNYLEGASVAGGKMKETGIMHWDEPNTGATNTSGFKALPGGSRYISGDFYDIGERGTWWSSSEDSTDNACFRYIDCNNNGIGKICYSKDMGLSVRCVKD
jgi:uncharacterized protein (TIGR02145 family)